MPDLYDAAQLLDKTLIAAQEVSIFDGVPRAGYMPTKIGVVKVGNPVGIVYSYINADLAENRDNLWWMFNGSADWKKPYYAPHAGGLYDVSALREQGVLSLTEQAQKEADANKPWYERILDNVLPVAAVVIVGAAFIRGYMSRK
jgi:hypothetical protein